MKLQSLVWHILTLLFLSSQLVFGSMNLNSASKEELLSIKGIGEKKAVQIIEYRKTKKIESADELDQLKGFGPKLIENIKNNQKVSVKK